MAAPGSPTGGAAPPSYEAPSLDAAGEHYLALLPHRIPSTNHKSGYRLARIGEEMGPRGEAPKLYDFFFDNIGAIDEFGIGIALYFRQLVFMGVVMTLCALISLPAIYRNIEFNPSDITPTLLGSVVGAIRCSLSIADQGASDISVCIFLGLMAVVAGFVETEATNRIDENQQTTQDYAIRASNLPDLRGRGITGERELAIYKDFFAQFGDVVFITLAKDNGEMIQALGRKRVFERELDHIIAREIYNQSVTDPKDKEPVPEESSLRPAMRMLRDRFDLPIFRTKEFYAREITEAKNLALRLVKQAYAVKEVFVVYNHETSQRRCLQELSTSMMQRWTGRGEQDKVFSPHWKELGVEPTLLHVVEPVEPTEVIYENLHVPVSRRVLRLAQSYAVSASILVMFFFILREIVESGENGAVFIAFTNAMLPFIMKIITSFEVHVDEGDLQQSMLTKLVAARMLNTALILHLVTPREDKFSEKALANVQAILIADCFQTPILRITIILVTLGYNYFFRAKKARTQHALDILFQPADWTLAERYTDMVKTIFVGLFYSSILPSALFITAGAMFTAYVTDKFALFYLWKRPPMFDGTLARQCRELIIFCILVHFIMARVFFANWPYLKFELAGADATTDAEREEDISECISRDLAVQPYRVDVPICNVVPCYASGAPWTADQSKVIDVYNGLYITMVVLAVLYAAIYGRLRQLVFFWRASNEVSDADAQETAYVRVPGIDAYIPNLHPGTLVNPLIAADWEKGGVPPRYLPVRQVADPDENRNRIAAATIAKEAEFDDMFANDSNDVSAETVDLAFSSVHYYGKEVKDLDFSAANAAWFQQSASPTKPPSTVNPVIAVIAGTTPSPANAAEPEAATKPEPKLDQEAASAAGPLPEGWDEAVDARGRIYYIDHINQVTQWNRPTATVTQQGSVADLQASSFASSSRGGLHRSSSSGNELPPGWEKKWDARSNRFYYVDHNTKKTQWKAPEEIMERAASIRNHDLLQEEQRQSRSLDEVGRGAGESKVTHL